MRKARQHNWMRQEGHKMRESFCSSPPLRYGAERPNLELTRKSLAVVEVIVLANVFAIVVDVQVRFHIAIPAFPARLADVAVPAGIVHGIANVACGFLRLALDLLGSAFHLGFGISGPLADLAFDAACSVIEAAFDLVLIHMSTSVGSVALSVRIRALRCKRRASACAPLRTNRKCLAAFTSYSAALRPEINWMASTTNASTSSR